MGITSAAFKFGLRASEETTPVMTIGQGIDKRQFFQLFLLLGYSFKQWAEDKGPDPEQDQNDSPQQQRHGQTQIPDSCPAVLRILRGQELQTPTQILDGGFT